VDLPLIKRLEASHSYAVLLAVILVSLIFQSAAPDARWSRVVIVALQALTLLLALWTSRTPERDFRWGLVAAVVAMVATGVLATRSNPDLHNGGVLVVGALVVLVVPAVIAHGVYHGIRQRGRVTMQAAFGALCIYLLIGMLFAFGFGAIAVLQNGALFSNGTEGDLQSHLYFSFITITTTGYGDLAPAGDLARSLAMLEALIGQLYLVTVVAVIVGNLGRSRPGQG
jgi:ABC-type multidrug transport system fused ATPase/permease subunit